MMITTILLFIGMLNTGTVARIMGGGAVMMVAGLCSNSAACLIPRGRGEPRLQ